MKIIQLVRPINETKRKELTRRLKEEEKRLLIAARNAKKAIQYDLSPSRLIKNYPFQAVAVCFLGAIIVGSLAKSRLN
jgi:hypothetical protein